MPADEEQPLGVARYEVGRICAQDRPQRNRVGPSEPTGSDFLDLGKGPGLSRLPYRDVESGMAS